MITYDKESDAWYLALDPSVLADLLEPDSPIKVDMSIPVGDCIPAAEFINVDVLRDGKIVGIENTSASSLVPPELLDNLTNLPASVQLWQDASIDRFGVLLRPSADATAFECEEGIWIRTDGRGLIVEFEFDEFSRRCPSWFFERSSNGRAADSPSDPNSAS